MKKHFKNQIFPFVIALGFLLIIANGCTKTETKDPLDGQTIAFGSLLDLSVNNPEEGLTTKASIEIAMADLNDYATAAGRNVTFTCSFEDTHLDTTEAKNLVESMYEKGIRMFVGGPYSSSELKAIAPFVKQNPVVVVNSTSTAIGLNQAGSHIFRIVPNDGFHAKAIIRAALTDGIKAMIPVVRNDVWGNSQMEVFRSGFEQEGGVVYTGVIYDPSETSFADVATEIESQANEAIATYGASKVAVLALTYSEITNLFTAAGQHESLGSVKWYGCESNVQLEAITSDNTLASFAVETGFMAPIMGIGDAEFTPDFAQSLSAEIEQQTGLVPNAYALTAYDATFIAGLAYLEAGTTDISKITTLIPLVCDSYSKMGVERRLNENGDLAKSNYIFWKVLQSQNGYYWEKVATYYQDKDKFDYR